jgi:hypothetical protein
LFAAASSHSFAQLATAIDDAFARWDRSHLHEFEFADGTRIGRPDPDTDDDDFLDETRERLSKLPASEQFIYSFDFGDDWAHLCTVVEVGIDPQEVLGVVPDAPLPYSVGETYRINMGGLGLKTTRRLRHQQIPN